VNTEQQIRDLFEAEVADLEPSPLGWDAIQRQLAGRRRRFVLQRALPAAAGLAVLAVLAVVLVPQLGDGDGRIEPNPPAASSTPAPATGSPIANALWPFTTTGQVAEWERDHPGEEDDWASPEQTISRFLRGYVGHHDSTLEIHPVPRMCPLVDCGPNTSFDVRESNGRPMGRVDVLDVTQDDTAGPYVVTRALMGSYEEGEPAVTLDVAPDQVVRAPAAQLHGVFFEADLADQANTMVRVSLRDAMGDEIDSADATLTDEKWRATLNPPPGRAAHSVIVTVLDDEGGVARFAAAPVIGAVTSPTATPAASASPEVTSLPSGPRTAPPAEFFAVKDGVVGMFRTADGSLVRAVSEPKPGGGAADPYVIPGRSVYFAQGAGTCSSGVDGNNWTGGPAKEVVAAGDGAISAPAYDGGSLMAYALSQCDGGRVDLVLNDIGNAIKEPKVLDSVTGAGASFRSPSWSKDGTRLAVVVGYGDQTGGSDEVRVYDPSSEQWAVVVPRQGCGFTAVAWQEDSVGRRLLSAQYCRQGEGFQARVYVAYTEEDGSAIGLSTSPLLARGSVPIMTLDVDPTGQHVLASESIRNRGIEVWRWDLRTDPVVIDVAPDLQSPAW
jgi:hypothetical protein